MLSLSRVYQLSGRLSRRIHPTTLEVGDFYAKMLKIDILAIRKVINERNFSALRQGGQYQNALC